MPIRRTAAIRLLVVVLAAGTSSAASCPRSHSVEEGVDAVAVGVGKALDAIPAPQRSGPPTGPLTIDPPEITFGMVATRATATRAATIMNKSQKAITISAVSVTGQFFRVNMPNLPVTLAPDARVELKVHFAPVDACRCQGKLIITTSDPVGQQTVVLSGSGAGER